MEQEKKTDEMKHAASEPGAVVLEEKKMEKEFSFKVNSSAIKGTIAGVAVLILASLGYYYRDCFIAATVDGSPVWRYSVMKGAEQQAGANVLEGLVMRKIVEQEISAKNIVLAKKDIADEIKKLEEQYPDLDAELSQRNITRSDLEDTIRLQKQMEKLIPETKATTDEEVDLYIEEQKVEIPEGQEETLRSQIKQGIEQEKKNEEIRKLLAGLKEKAKVTKLVSY